MGRIDRARQVPAIQSNYMRESFYELFELYIWSTKDELLVDQWR